MGDFRKTKSVQLILDKFGQSNAALSVVDLVKTFQDEMNKTTVYRVLDRLEENRMLHSFTGKDGLKWYAGCSGQNPNKSDCHPHFQCHECGKTECLPIDFAVPTVADYSVASANLLLTGKCKDCIAK